MAGTNSTVRPMVIEIPLAVHGDVSLFSNLTVGGVITSITTSANTLTLGGKDPALVDSGQDVGFQFQWNNGSASKLGFIGFQRSSSKFALIPDATLSAGVYSGTIGTLIGNLQGRADIATNADHATLADTATSALAALKFTTARTITAMGDISWTTGVFDGSANVSGVATLATTGVTAGLYNNSATAVNPMTFDAKGRLIAVGSAVTLLPLWSSIQSTPTTLSGYGITDGVRSASVTTANGVSGTVTGNTALAFSLTLGAITPTSVAATGAVSGSTLSGAGSAITALNASNIASGTVAPARLGTGTASASTFLTGASTYLTAVTALSVATANGISGSVTATGTPVITLALGAITPTSIVSSGAISGTTGAFSGVLSAAATSVSTLTASGTVTGNLFSGSGASLTNLSTAALTGTVSTANLGTGTASATTYLAGDNTWKTTPIGSVTAVSVTTANGISGSSTGGATPALTITLGAITPTSVAASGAVSGSTLTGAGSAITSLNASNLASGTVPLAQIGTGTPYAASYLAGDNSWKPFPTITNGTVTAVTVAAANGITGTVTNQGTTPALTIVLGAITPSSINTTGSVTAASFIGSGSGLTSIPSSVLSGLVPVSNLGTSTANATTYLAGDQTWKTTPLGSVTTVSITTANGISGSVATASSTPAITLTLGAITPTSVSASGAISGSTFMGSGSGLTAVPAASLTGVVPTVNLGTGTKDATTFLSGDQTYKTALTALSIVTANGVSGSIATGTTTPAITITLGAITPSSVTATGALTGATLVGAGSAITTLNASSLATGTVAIGRLGLTGTPSATTYLAGDNSWKTTPIGTVTAVTVTTANGVSAAISTQGTTPALTFTLGDITPSSVVSSGVLTGSTVTATAGFSGPGSAITALNASNLASGTVSTIRLGSGTAAATNFLSGDQTWKTALTSLAVTTANGVSASVGGTVNSPALTFILGAITPSSVTASGAVTGSTLIAPNSIINSLGARINGALVGYSFLSTNTNVDASYLIATLPPSSGATYDQINIICNLTDNWYSNSNRLMKVMLANRTGFVGRTLSIEGGAVSAAAKIVAYSQTDGSVAVYVVMAAYYYATLALDVRISQNVTLVSSPTSITTAPAGTVVYDSSTAVPLFLTDTTGQLQANSFSGSGTALTALNASNLLSGTVAVARLGTGTTIDGTTFLAGDQTYKTALTGATITGNNGILTSFSVTAPASFNVPTITFSLGAITPTSVAASGAVSGATLAGAGSAITALNASNLASGTTPLARIGTGTPSAITRLAGDNSWVTEKVLQVVTGSITSSSGNAAIPYDNTVPTTAEGNLIWSQAFTPLSATSTIVITTSSFFSVGSVLSFTVSGAVFSDTTCIGAQKLGFTNNASGGEQFLRGCKAGCRFYRCSYLFVQSRS